MFTYRFDELRIQTFGRSIEIPLRSLKHNNYYIKSLRQCDVNTSQHDGVVTIDIHEPVVDTSCRSAICALSMHVPWKLLFEELYGGSNGLQKQKREAHIVVIIVSALERVYMFRLK